MFRLTTNLSPTDRPTDRPTNRPTKTQWTHVLLSPIRFPAASSDPVCGHVGRSMATLRLPMRSRLGLAMHDDTDTTQVI